MSFFEELKRRNVARVAVLYVIASWLLLQVTDVLSSLLPVPEWAGSFVVMLLLLGFFPVMVFSWLYEMTPEGLKREKDIDRSQSVTPETGRKINVLIIVMLVLAIAAVVVDQLIGQVSPFVLIGVIVLLVVAAIVLARLVPFATPSAVLAEATATTAQPVTKPAGSTRKAVAVLPFVNMSSDDEQEYFSDGLSEELLNLLTKIPELQVAARTSSFSFKGQDLEIQEIAKRLKVAHVLEGSVRKSGDRVRITAQLIQAEDGYHLWSETYDRTLDDIFAIQDEIAAEVVDQLRITLLGAAPTVRETDPGAYALVLQARHLTRQSTTGSWEQSVSLYKQALAIAPDYVPAWVGLANVYTRQSDKGLRPIEEGYGLAREAADKALNIDPDYARGHAMLGWIAMTHDRDLSLAARHYERALALAPTDNHILAGAALLCESLGHPDKAISLGEYVVARDPMNPARHYELAGFYRWSGRLDDSVASLRTTLTLSPDFMGAHFYIGLALLYKGELEAALASIKQSPHLGYRLMGLPLAHHALGQEAASEAAVAELIEKYAHGAAYDVAYIYAFRGETDRAFAWLAKAVNQNDPGLSAITVEDLFSNIHSDPRWLPFLESIGKSPEQLAAIGFEVVLPE
jgi:TolB-like protein/Tfp pilus assembly protein PilF